MKKLFLILSIFATMIFSLSSNVYATRDFETILSTQTGFVVSADEQSRVVLFATYKDKSLYAYDVNIEIQSVITGKTLLKIEPNSNSGYCPRLLIFNFDDKKTCQLFLGMDTGGSGGYGIFYVYSVRNLELRTLFDYEKFSDDNIYKGKYIDNFKAEITSIKPKLSYIIDLSLKPKAYLSNIYDEKGKLKFVTKVEISDVNSVFPYFNATVNKFELSVFQRISGLYSADKLGYMNNLLSLEDDKFKSYFTTCNTFGY